MPKTLWPEIDGRAFDALFADGGLLDDRGPLAHWRAPSRELMERQYGRWLDWIGRHDPCALPLEPCLRATPERLQCWVASREDLSPATLFGDVDAVLRLCRFRNPDQNWTRHQRLLSHLHRAVKRRGSPRKTGRVLSSHVLLEAGMRLVQDSAGTVTHPDDAVRIRDGAMICLLALIPIRRRALAALEIGTSLLVQDSRMTICLDEAMTKNGQPWEADIPDAARQALETYLAEARPFLAARQSEVRRALWLGRNGAPITAKQITRLVANRTEQLLGKRLCPHLFRDAAATTLARDAPSSARSIKTILGQSSSRIAEGHYIQADTIAAGRGLAAALDALKERS